jgi:hypothetical protein
VPFLGIGGRAGGDGQPGEANAQAGILSPGLSRRTRLMSDVFVHHRADAGLKGGSRWLESNALNGFGRDFEYKSHRIASKLDVASSSLVSRSPYGFRRAAERREV